MFRKHRQEETPKPAAPTTPQSTNTPQVTRPTAPVNRPDRSSTDNQASAAQQPNAPRTLVVGRGISVQGTIQDAERLIVEGLVESSSIKAKTLIVAPDGVFKGTVEVENAELAGTVDGTLVVRNNLKVMGTGRLLGKAECRNFQVELGGQVTAQLEMLPASGPKTEI
ncbi:polymer-forming cytoskeletal protein [Formicincola oecophyllae]|uniref:Polymer-forming cytoskeletal protein n=1 Tax=Formicincola oecophyllae TaxID=2558361 RepID=A0A4Y6UB57_9PROT|nr:polymer-forming cytoskeletal protein [Formicincola oecophyllae]QDH13696.1 polymer-forming cytoskeletal protein [Formicincola oecophyllae]